MRVLDFSWILLEINDKRKALDITPNAVIVFADSELKFTPAEVDKGTIFLLFPFPPLPFLWDSGKVLAKSLLPCGNDVHGLYGRVYGQIEVYEFS